ncbi:ribonuclease H [Senna tora]|uniref:Ribonuclease H n=1 Tax=Senna tora TaxID=362788 RepID=A0A834WZB5_9FABA|nr:ribonuclease H [Senna tora]
MVTDTIGKDNDNLAATVSNEVSALMQQEAHHNGVDSGKPQVISDNGNDDGLALGIWSDGLIGDLDREVPRHDDVGTSHVVMHTNLIASNHVAKGKITSRDAHRRNATQPVKPMSVARPIHYQSMMALKDIDNNSSQATNSLEKGGPDQAKVHVPCHITGLRQVLTSIMMRPLDHVIDVMDEGKAVSSDAHEDAKSVAFLFFLSFPMNYSIWNSRGTGANSFLGLIKDINRRHKVDFLAILKPRKSGLNASNIVKRLGFEIRNRVEANSFSGGIWCMWNKSLLNVEVLIKHPQFMHLRVKNSSMPWFFTVVYGNLNVNLCRTLWDNLQLLSTSVTGPWPIASDFNTFLFEFEKCGGISHSSKPNLGFRDWIDSSCLMDLGFSATEFTWHRGNVAIRLDRVVANQS